MIPIKDAEIMVYDPGYISHQATIPKEDIINVKLTERTGRRKDDGDIVINNDNGQYDDLITSGDTLEFKVGFAGNNLTPWGEGDWGDGRWAFMRTVWLARVRDRNFSFEGEEICDLELDCEDWAFSVLSDRTVTREYKQVPANRIVQEILQITEPRIRAYVDPSLNKRMTIKFDGESAFDAIEEILNEVEAEARSWRQFLSIQKSFEKTPKFEITHKDLHIDKVLEADGDLANYVRLHGGQAISEGQRKITDTHYYQPIQPGEQRSFQIYTEKSQLARLDLRLSVTREPRRSPITVRIQKNDSGVPLDPDDSTKDIASARMDYEEIMKHYNGEEGRQLWVTFEFGEHTLPEPNPWIIIEVEGDSAQRFVFDAEMTPSHIPYFPYQIIATDQNFESISEYGKREIRVDASHVTSNQEAEQLAQRKLNKFNRLEKVVQGQAQTWRMHNLRPGEVVTMDFDRYNLSGEYMVSERQGTYDDIHLDTNFSFENI